MKNKKMMKLTALGLAMITVLTGCGNSITENNTSSASEEVTETSEQAAVSAEDAPVLNIVLPTAGTKTEGSKDVEAEINKILLEETGAQINIVWTALGDLAQQLNMMLTNADECDISFLFNSPATYIRNGQTLDLTKYIDGEEGKEIREIIGDVYVDANRQEDGEIYYIPSNIDRSTELAFAANRSMMLEMGYEIDDEKIWTFEELHDLINEAMEKYPNIYGVVPCSGTQMVEKMGFDSMGDSSNIGVIENRGTGDKVVSITECQEYIDFSHRMHDWYQEGLIMADVMSNNESSIAYISSGKAFGSFVSGPCPNGMESEDSYRVLLSLSDQWVPSNAAERMGFIINAQTRYPDQAFSVLNEMYTNEEIKTLLSYGIEGVNYVKSEDGRAAYPDGIDADTASYNVGFLNWWAFPNGQCELTPYTQSPEYWNIQKEYDNAAEVTPLLGCIFKTDEVQDAYSACTNVVNEYYNAILSGAVDTDATLQEFSEALKDAGEDTIIAEKQRQMDAFLNK